MVYIGIDLGGTNIAAGVVNEKMELIYKTSIPTESKTGEDIPFSGMQMARITVVLVK